MKGKHLSLPNSENVLKKKCFVWFSYWNKQQTDGSMPLIPKPATGHIPEPLATNSDSEYVFCDVMWCTNSGRY
jgi:hypothetical protein